MANFTRVGAVCYHFSESPTDWKTANVACRKLRGHLLELDDERERRALIAGMLADKRIRGASAFRKPRRLSIIGTIRDMRD